MKKRIIIILSVVLCIVLTSIGIVFANGALNPADMVPSDYKIGMPYREAVQSDKPMLVLFYTDWCGYCKRFMPKYKTINKLYKDNYNFVMLNAEAQENLNLVNDVAVTGLPTVYIFDPKYNNRIHLSNGIYMDLKKMRTELDRYLNIRKQLDISQTCATQ